MRTLASLLLVFVIALTGCKSAAKRKKDAEAAAQKKRDAEQTASPHQDFNAFLGRLRKAVAARDMNTIAAMMTSDFAYVMGDSEGQDRKGEGVFQFWDENGLWPELEGILSEKFVAKGDDWMVAPPQFANPAIDYEGYRAGIRRVGGSWKFAYFVNG